jgi:hypothetical protein
VEAGRFDLLAASLRADARDLDAFFEVLAVKLSASFPESTNVDREGFRGRGRVKSISVNFGEHRYDLARNATDVPEGARRARDRPEERGARVGRLDRLALVRPVRGGRPE